MIRNDHVKMAIGVDAYIYFGIVWRNQKRNGQAQRISRVGMRLGRGTASQYAAQNECEAEDEFWLHGFSVGRSVPMSVFV